MKTNSPSNPLGFSFHPSVFSEVAEDELINLLHENRITHVELPLDNQEHAGLFIEAGFSLSYHGPINWLNGWINNRNEFREWLNRSISTLPVMSGENKPIIILHPATRAIGEKPQLSRSELFSNSIEFIRFANELGQKHFGACTIALENMTHGKSKMRIGDTIEELVELRRSTGIDEVKFCWDIGHHIMSRRFLPEQKIPDEFLDNVAIVHLHGVEGKDRPRDKWWDHYHLNSNSISWEKYINCLQDRDYTGPVTLEIFVGLRQSTQITVENLDCSFKIINNHLEWKERLLRRKRWLPPLFEHIKPGKIVEFGCGNGFVLEDLSKKFPNSQIVGIDKNQERLNGINEKNLPNVETLNADITIQIFPNKSIDSVLYVGVLHEVFSLSGRGKVRETLKLGHDALKDDGILIIQDFLKPEPHEVTLIFKNQRTRSMFFLYVKEFRLWPVKYKEIKGCVKLDIVDALEFLTKYRPPSEEDWIEEMNEAHHYFALGDFRDVANEAGFTIKTSIILLNEEDYFQEIRKDMDFDFDESEKAWIQLVLEKRRSD